MVTALALSSSMNAPAALSTTVSPGPAEIVPRFNVRLALEPVAKIPVLPPELATSDPIATLPLAVRVTFPVPETAAAPSVVKAPPDELIDTAPALVETPASRATFPVAFSVTFPAPVMGDEAASVSGASVPDAVSVKSPPGETDVLIVKLAPVALIEVAVEASAVLNALRVEDPNAVPRSICRAL